MTTTHASKDEYHHGNLAETLLRAVEEIIDERGIGNVSLREAARRAGVSHSAPAHHFGDKEGLLAAFAEEGFARFAEHLAASRQALAAEPVTVQSAAMGRAYVEFAVANRAHFEAMFRAGLDKTDSTTPLGSAAGSSFGVLEQLVADLQSSGVLADVDPRHVATYLWSISHGLATLILDGILVNFYEEELIEDVIAGVMELNTMEAPV